MGWLSLLFQIILCLHVLLFDFPSFCFSSCADSLCRGKQCAALLRLKSSFIINTTTTYTNLCNEPLTVKMATWENGTDCCSWLGVTCDAISGNVIGLNLNCDGIQGTIHHNSSLFQLSHLQTLILSSNDFSASQLSSQLGGFRSLKYLDLSNTGIQGEIPSQISHLSKLLSLDLTWNDQLKWKETTLKRLVRNATSLRELVLDYTDMSSIKPSSVFSLLNGSTSLVTLSLGSTELSGNLTNGFLCAPNLQKLVLSSNYDLQGQFPWLSCTASSLTVLDLSFCRFQGSIPPSFSNLTCLTSIDLSGNNLSGSILSSLLTLPRLTSLDLSYNALSSRIPNVSHQSSRLQELHLSNNKLGGELPPSLTNLQHLIDLDLSSNTFSGPIPNVFGRLTKLEELNLNNNNLRGEIPSSLFDLTHLSSFDCSYNKLEGSLPNQIIGLLPNMSELLLDNNFLNGTIPSWCLSLPSLVILDLSNNHFSGHVSAISANSLYQLNLCNNKLQGNIPQSIFNLGHLTDLCLSSNNWTGRIDFHLFSKLQNLESLDLSQNSQLLLTFESDQNYSLSSLTSLKLSSVGLNEFPNLVGKFPNLIYLDLSNNKLKGRVPDCLHELDSLNFLNISQNLLTSILRLPRHHGLTVLDLSFNLLSGDISLLVCHVSTSLEVLNLSYNNLTGIIPRCLAKLSALQVLDLQMNRLHGTLRTTFSKINQLETLNLNGNQLVGLLPNSLSNCRQLQVLDLGNNQIEGTFPFWLQTLPYLEVLVLRGNKLQGPIANSKSKPVFPSLIIFDISGNNFSGRIPKGYVQNFEAMKNVVQGEVDGILQYIEQTSFLNVSGSDIFHEFYDYVNVTIKGNSVTLTKILTIFVSIDLSRNNFEGEIPDDIGELHAVKGLNLSHNRLMGAIPRSMGNLSSLESLDLSSNMLTGEIPIELTNLNYLEVLDVSYNHLVGEVPKGKQFNTFSNDSYEGNLGLCGFPMSVKCNPGQYSPQPSWTLRSEEKFGFGWKPVAIGYGCGMVLGLGLGCLVFLIGKPQWLVSMVGGKSSKRVTMRTGGTR